MGWTIAGIVCLALQVLSWIGNGGIPLAGGLYGISYSLGANFALILGVVFLYLGYRHKGKQSQDKDSQNNDKQ